jgi:uncharacterized protein
MKKLCLVLILLIIFPAVNVNAFKYDVVREVNLDVPAVSQTSEGLVGVLSRLNVAVAYPGSGRVYFSATPLTELDTQATARVAALVSSSVIGDEYLRYDFFVSLESESLIIGGPSAGAAIAAAMMVAILNIKGLDVNVRSDVTLTGMINPDGTIGPVGGVYAKMKAAAEKGYRIFIVPYGQSIDYVEKTVVEQRGPLRIIRTVREKVDLVSEGERLGVRVVEALTIYDVFKYLTGYEFKAKEYAVFMPKDVRERLKSWSISLLDEYDGLASYKYDSRLSNAVGEASKLASEARSMIDTSPYVSASRAFSALCMMYYVKYADEYLKSSNKGKYINDLVDSVNKTLVEVESALNSTSPSIRCIEAYIGAKIRYAEALETLNNALNAMNSGAILNMYDGCIYYLAYSRQRAISAMSWLEFNVAGVPVDLNTLMKSSSILLYEAQSILGYVSSLYSDIGQSSSIVNEASEMYDKAKKAFISKDYYLTIGYSIESIAYSTVAIHLAFTSNIEAVIDASSSIASNAIGNAIEAGLDPVLSLSYLELAQSEASNTDKLYYYILSATYSKTALTISRAVNTTAPIPIATYTEEPKPKTSTPYSKTPTTTSNSLRQETIQQVVTIAAIILLILSIAVVYLYSRSKKIPN